MLHIYHGIQTSSIKLHSLGKTKKTIGIISSLCFFLLHKALKNKWQSFYLSAKIIIILGTCINSSQMKISVPLLASYRLPSTAGGTRAPGVGGSPTVTQEQYQGLSFRRCNWPSQVIREGCKSSATNTRKWPVVVLKAVTLWDSNEFLQAQAFGPTG